MQRKNWLVLAVMLMICVYAVFAQNSDKIVESEGKFSYIPPRGWTVTEYPGLKYKVVIGPAEENFSANMTFIDEEYDGNLKSYVDLSIENLRPLFQDLKVLSREQIKLKSGIAGEKVEINNTQYNLFLRQVFYLIPAKKGKYLVIAASVLDSEMARYMPLFDECVKTIELLR